MVKSELHEIDASVAQGNGGSFGNSALQRSSLEPTRKICLFHSPTLKDVAVGHEIN